RPAPTNGRVWPELAATDRICGVKAELRLFYQVFSCENSLAQRERTGKARCAQEPSADRGDGIMEPPSLEPSMPMTTPGGARSVDDPRIYLAAERTFLAWIRTSLALMGFGF